MTDTPPAADDRAWVTIDTPLTVAELREFCRDLGRLFRINPGLEFSVWQGTAPGRYHAEWLNLSNGQTQVLELAVVTESDSVFRVDYDQGLKAWTRFAIEPAPGGARLTITDDYGRLPPEERTARLAEVDRSLPAWGRGIHRYLRRQRRWGWLAPWRWFMRRLWLPMKPSARRIVWWLWVISVAEFLFFLFVLLVYVIERSR